MYDHTKKEFKVTGEEQLSLGKMQGADENYGDGSRISEHMMNSLYIFCGSESSTTQRWWGVKI